MIEINTGKPFEQSVKKLMEQSGFQITRKPRPSGDGGVDMIATHPSPLGATQWIIQCKDTNLVGRKVVDELVGTIAREKGHIGLIITTGRFTKDAEQAAQGHASIILIDGPQYQKCSLKSLEITSPSYRQKTIDMNTRPCQIQRDTIRKLIEIIEQEAAPMTMTINTPTKIPKKLRQLAKSVGNIHHHRIKPEKEDPGK